MKRLLVVAVLALVAGGCVSAGELKAKKAELLAAYRLEANMPEPTPIPPEIDKALDAKVEEWRVEENRKRLETVGGIGGKAMTGDWIGAVLIALGLGGTLLKNKGGAA